MQCHISELTTADVYCADTVCNYCGATDQIVNDWRGGISVCQACGTVVSQGLTRDTRLDTTRAPLPEAHLEDTATTVAQDHEQLQHKSNTKKRARDDTTAATSSGITLSVKRTVVDTHTSLLVEGSRTLRSLATRLQMPSYVTDDAVTTWLALDEKIRANAALPRAQRNEDLPEHLSYTQRIIPAILALVAAEHQLVIPPAQIANYAGIPPKAFKNCLKRLRLWLPDRFRDPFWSEVRTQILRCSTRLAMRYDVQDKALEQMAQLQHMGIKFNIRKDPRVVAAALVYLGAKAAGGKTAILQGHVAKIAEVCTTALSVTSHQIKLKLAEAADYQRKRAAQQALLELQTLTAKVRTRLQTVFANTTEI